MRDSTFQNINGRQCTLDRKLLENLLKTSAVYVVLIATATWFLYLQPVAFALDTSFGLIRVDATPFYQPLMAILICNYASKIVTLLLRGRIVEPLRRTVRYLGLALAIILLDRQHVVPVDLSSLGYLILFLIFVFGPHAIVKALLLERDKEIFIHVIDAVALLAVGYVLSWVWGPINQQILSLGIFSETTVQEPYLRLAQTLLISFFNNLSTAIRLSFTLAAVLALFGLLRVNANPYMSLAAGRLGTNLANKFILIFLVTNYFLSLRGLLISNSVLDHQLITVSEWVLLCIGAIYIFYDARKYINNNLVGGDVPGEWRTHIQKITQVEDNEMKRVSGMINLYLEKGEKSQLILYMVELLRGLGLTSSRIDVMLSPMINHSDTRGDRSTFNWLYTLVLQQEKQKRRNIMDKLLSELKKHETTPKIAEVEQEVKI